MPEALTPALIRLRTSRIVAYLHAILRSALADAVRDHVAADLVVAGACRDGKTAGALLAVAVARRG